MSNSVTIFDFGDYRVRTMLRNGVAWFILADVCAVLSIKNPTQAAARLDDDEKAMSDIGLGVGSNPTIISEAGLYRLVLRSDKPQARPFQKWVTSVVLPTLRKDGAYVVGEEHMDDETLILRAHEALERKVARLEVYGGEKPPHKAPALSSRMMGQPVGATCGGGLLGQ